MFFLNSPLEQFSIYQSFTIFIKMKLFGCTLLFDESISVFSIENFNNLFMFFLIIYMHLFFINRRTVYENFALISVYNFLYSIIEQQVKDWIYIDKYFILTSTAFIFILVNNIFGMIPYSFVSTAQLGQNFFLSSSLISYFTLIGFYYLELKFLNIFMPSAPAVLLPFLVIIEIISYIARAFSLAIRLFANLMSGHTLLFILCSFNSVILFANFYGFLIASVLILLIFGLELVIAFMQAYVFTVLISVYLKDSTALAEH